MACSFTCVQVLMTLHVLQRLRPPLLPDIFAQVKYFDITRVLGVNYFSPVLCSLILIHVSSTTAYRHCTFVVRHFSEHRYLTVLLSHFIFVVVQLDLYFCPWGGCSVRAMKRSTDALVVIHFYFVVYHVVGTIHSHPMEWLVIAGHCWIAWTWS